ncbi:MAG TPA: class I SAM-dependent rRNA methyltransferase [Candidatus Binataceae bacterium]
MTITGRIFLKPGRDGPVRGGNPWIFSQAIAKVEPAALGAGDWVQVLDAGGDAVGVGYYNPATTIAVRMVAFDAALQPEQIIRHRIERAIALRRRVIRGDTDCYRMVNGDGDGLSGVVVDRYGSVLVVQLLTAGADRMRGEIVAALRELVTPLAASALSIIERSHGAVRKQEGLADHSEVLAGTPPSETIAVEHGIRLAIDIDRGQKTGAFLDQRENRALLRELARGARVLDAYCYGGGFSLAAIAGEARAVVAVDSSERALATAQRNLDLNGYRGSRAELIRSDAVRYLAEIGEANPATAASRFDLIVIDPPPLARSIKDVAHAARLYTDLNAFAMRALAPGGYLMTFSCSMHFRGEDFVRAVRIAQTKSGRRLQMIARLGPGPDHPVLLGHAEGEYLTGLLLADLA